ncbi:FAD-binding oxidoreductase [Bradyrhizobium sp. WD16]|uniref:NAD(P)/FAD-dependent oxidoreductase n=1 Tax=Bradyrhizobium sp. WD16 TaxID=1521768 RepID=UPI0020A34705|nr:FAD-binding oxidoreductase [Bradyrhizobium sp. WD16]UTD27939.1 FAD-dependent oxidoreductase [Bradyrhizobium sp. WD16]
MTKIRSALSDATLYPYWLDNASAPAPEPQLIGRTQADLVIVGGGFTGLWAAVIAKQADPGRDIMVIEAGRIGHGASGRPGGIVSTSVMHGLVNASRIFPNDMPVLEALGHENLDGWKRTLVENKADVDLEWGGELTVAVEKAQVPRLQREFELHKLYGHDAVLLDREQVQAQVASPLFSAGVWSLGKSGTVHPAKLAWELKRIAKGLGVRMHELTPMTGVEDLGDRLAIITHDGRIVAHRALFATNAWGAGHAHIKRRIVGVRDRVLATEPLTAEQLARLGWRNRQGVYDTRLQLNYMRLTSDNRIVFGGRVGYFYNDDVDPAADRQITTYERLAASFFKTFPQLDDVRFSHAWSGPIDLSKRMAVHFQRYYGGKGIWVGGYSGFGVTATRFGARVGLDILYGADKPELRLEFASTLPGYIPPEPFRWIGAKLTMYALDEADTKGGWRRLWINLVHQLGFPL